MTSIPQEDARYLRSPRVRPTERGARLEVIAWERAVMPGPIPGVAGHERVLSWEVDADGVLHGPSEGAEHEAIPVWVGAIADADAELEARDGDAHVWVTNVEGVAEVWLERSERRVLVWRAWGCAPASCWPRSPASSPGATCCRARSCPWSSRC